MKIIGNYLLIGLGVSTTIVSIYQLFQDNDYYLPVCSIIIGVFLVKTSFEKMKLQKELDQNKN